MRATARMKMLTALCVTAVLSGWAAPESPVADAAMRGDVDGVRSLVKEGADVNAAQGDGMTALHWAAERGDAQMAELLVYAGANVKAGTRIGGYTPLHLASKAGSAAIVKALIEAGSDVNAATTNSGATPLHLAAGSGSVESVSALAAAGANVNVRDLEWGQTPLHHAAGWNRAAAVKALLAAGADPNLTSMAVNVARMAAVDQMAQRRMQQVLGQFRPKDAPEAEWQPSPGQLESAVKEARSIQRANSADREYQDGKLEDDQAADYPLRVGAWGGLTPLLHAVRQGYVETTVALLDGGADIDKVSAGDHTSPLMMATVNGQYDISMLLIQRGADVNLVSDAGAGPLYAAIERQWAPKSRYPQPQEYEQQKATYLDVMEGLLAAGADPNVRLSKHLWYMEYTFEHLRVDTKGATPFWRAAYGTDVDAMRLLHKYGADPSLSTIKLADKGFVFDDYQGEDGSGQPPVRPGGPAVHPIHAATGAGYGEGFAANHHRHAADGWLPSVQFLVGELGLDPNLRDHNGYTALHHAAARGDNPTIEYLVSKGADVTAVSRRGQTTADMANGPYQRIQPFPATVALLEKLGSKNNHRCLSC